MIKEISIGGHYHLPLLHFYAFTIRTTNSDKKQKFNQNLQENAVEAVKSYFAPQDMFY